MKDFMSFGWVLPWGNDGRGTVIKLWPFVGLAIIVVLMLAHHWFMA